jgi:hypothetical protein
MLAWFANLRALAGLTVIDALRQRLWLLFVFACALLLLVLPNLSAVDEGARFKLAVVAMSSAIGFVVVMLGILVAAAGLRRDLDARIGFLLFSKPLRMSAYITGKWTGVQLGLALGLVVLGLMSSAILAWQFHGLPTMRAINRSVAWEQVGSFGQPIVIDENRSRLQLTGAPGNGIRWRFTDVPKSSASADGLEVLLRVGVRGFSFDEPALDALAQITAFGVADQPPRILSLDAASPYGHSRGGTPTPVGQVVLRDRDETRDDLAQDYLRLRLPVDVIAADGSVTIQLTRLEARSSISVARDSSAIIAVDGGSFISNLMRSLFIMLASASLLTAFTLMIAAIANLGVATLGGLTLFFAGSATGAMREIVNTDRTAYAIRRLLQLALDIIPDFDRFTVAARLAAHESISWSMVGSAWIYYGSYVLFFLGLAWIAMRRQEL